MARARIAAHDARRPRDRCRHAAQRAQPCQALAHPPRRVSRHRAGPRRSYRRARRMIIAPGRSRRRELSFLAPLRERPLVPCPAARGELRQPSSLLPAPHRSARRHPRPYHNVILLRDVLVTDASLPREEAARCLRVVARYQRVLSRHAEILGARIYTERPRRFVRRVRHLWREAPPEDREAR